MMRKNKQNQVEQNNKTYQLLFDRLSCAVAYIEPVVHDKSKQKDYLFIDVNPSFELLMNLKLDDVYQKTMTTLHNKNPDKYDWVPYVLNFDSFAFETSSEFFSISLQKWLKISIKPIEMDKLVLSIMDVSDEKEKLQILINLTSMTETFFKSDFQDLDYGLIAQSMLKLCDARFVSINLYEDDKRISLTKAVVGDKTYIQKAHEMLGQQFENRTWFNDESKIEQVKNQKVTIYRDINDLIQSHLPNTIISMLAKLFRIGQTVLINIQKDDEIFGDMVVVCKENQDFKMNGYIEAFINQLVLLFERRQHEIELHSSEEQYKLLTSQMQLGLALHEIICDAQGNPIDYRFISVNQKFQEMTGLIESQVVGKTVLEVLPNTEKYWIDVYGKVALTGESINYENYASELNRYYSVSAYSPRFGQFAVLIDDITKQKQTHIELRNVNAALIESQQVAKVGAWRRDVKQGVNFWSKEIFNLYGLEPSDKVPSFEVVLNLFNDSDQQKLTTAREEALSNGSEYALELKLVKGRNANNWVLIKGNPIINTDGSIMGVHGTVQDITERKLAEIDNEQAILELKKSQKVAKLGTWVRDLITDQGQWSDELFYIYGFRPRKHALPTHEVNELFTPESRKILVDSVEKLKRTGEPFEQELELIAKNGVQKWVWIRSEAEKDDRGEIRYLRGVVLDITERKVLENKLLLLSYHDYLTGLKNRRCFEEKLQEVDNKDSLPLSIIMIDVNGLKVVNDSFGHLAGDELLKKASSTIQSICRKDDFIARIGGDEFVVLMPRTSAQECLELANKIKERATLEIIQHIHLSLSYGYDTRLSMSQSLNEVVANAENYMYRHKLSERNSIRSQTIDLILNALFAKSLREAEHSDRVSKLCRALAFEMNLNNQMIDEIELAGLIHDIGKIGVEEKILNKNGRLTPEEMNEMHKHPEIGWRILSSANEFSKLGLYVLHHHERWDGSGYPSGLRGNEIELQARIISVADAYDAMTSKRSYRDGISKEEAIKELLKHSGFHFDPDIVEIFINQVLKNKTYESIYRD
jgi:diguanylate cyclase